MSGEELETESELELLREALAAATERARVRGWHIAEVRKLHSWTYRPTAAECICGLTRCATLRALSLLERLAPAGPVANRPSWVSEAATEHLTDADGIPHA